MSVERWNKPLLPLLLLILLPLLVRWADTSLDDGDFMVVMALLVVEEVVGRRPLLPLILLLGVLGRL